MLLGRGCEAVRGASVDSEDTQTLPRPRARLTSTLGEELISSERVALTELVGNAYDADASSVVIRFNGPLEEGYGSIEVVGPRTRCVLRDRPGHLGGDCDTVPEPCPAQ